MDVNALPPDARENPLILQPPATDDIEAAPEVLQLNLYSFGAIGENHVFANVANIFRYELKSINVQAGARWFQESVVTANFLKDLEALQRQVNLLGSTSDPGSVMAFQEINGEMIFEKDFLIETVKEFKTYFPDPFEMATIDRIQSPLAEYYRWKAKEDLYGSYYQKVEMAAHLLEINNLNEAPQWVTVCDQRSKAYSICYGYLNQPLSGLVGKQWSRIPFIDIVAAGKEYPVKWKLIENLISHSGWVKNIFVSSLFNVFRYVRNPFTK